MQQTKEPNPAVATFASLLSALAAPAPKPEPEWDDEPAEELATLSYESALKAHARYKPSPDPVNLPPVAPAPSATQAPAAFPAQADDSYVPHTAAPAPVRAPEPPPAQGKPKTASITIRMSEDECAQLRRRAEEAGMTISAYLRSCTFEAETLRAQVKEAMAELRAATIAAALSSQPLPAADPGPDPLPAPRRSWRHMVERILPGTQPYQHAVRA
jgi:hypothetical protein